MNSNDDHTAAKTRLEQLCADATFASCGYLLAVDGEQVIMTTDTGDRSTAPLAAIIEAEARHPFAEVGPENSWICDATPAIVRWTTLEA